MADTLVKFLESLAEPVINWNSFSQAIRVESKDEAYRVVEGLDDVVSSNFAIFRLKIGMLTFRNNRMQTRYFILSLSFEF